jgi:hypothetical protein
MNENVQNGHNSGGADITVMNENVQNGHNSGGDLGSSLANEAPESEQPKFAGKCDNACF